MTALINLSTRLQAPTESTPTPPPDPIPFTVQDQVTLSSAGDRKHEADNN